MIKKISGYFVEWCYERIDLDDSVVLDVETTGLGSNDQCVEITIIGMSCEILFSELIRPSCPIGDGAASVHHISEAMVAQARTFVEAWPEIERAIGGRNVITWNAEFDLRMLRQTAAAHNVNLPEMTFYCAMREYTRYGNFQKWARLTEACAHQGVDFQQSHRALWDTLATLEIIRALAKKAEVKA
jgi:DNA polymerase III subunit epsilon